MRLRAGAGSRLSWLHSAVWIVDDEPDIAFVASVRVVAGRPVDAIEVPEQKFLERAGRGIAAIRPGKVAARRVR